MKNPDLSLVPLDALISEIEKRSDCFIMAWTIRDPEDKDARYTQKGKGRWFDAIALASHLNNEVLNNWLGEHQTLQRIHNEGRY
jgi:hypothetical protein